MTSIVPSLGTGEVSPNALRATLSRFCTGITVVTAMSDAGPAGFTCQSFSALSLDPPLVLLCPSRTSTSWPRIARADAFTVSVAGADHEQLCRDFAVPGGDKFAGREWVTSSRTGAPVPPEALATIDCIPAAQHDGGDHVIVIADVIGVDHTDGDPVLFFRSGFRRIAS